MTDWEARLFSIVLLLMVAVISVPLNTSQAEGLPVDYPVSLTGGYAVETEEQGVYIDFLQPQGKENYLLRVENRFNYQVRYRIEVSNVPQNWVVFLETGGRSAVVDLEGLATRSLYIYVKNPTPGTGDILINTTLEGTEDFWPITLRITCQTGPLLIAPVGTTFNVGRTTPVEFDVLLSNVGSSVVNVTLNMDRMVFSDRSSEGTWTYSFTPKAFILQSGKNMTVRAIIRASETEKLGAQYLSAVEAIVEGISRPFTSIQLTFKVATIYDLRATVSPADYQKVAPGGAVQFNVTLYNLADDTDYISVSEYEKPSDWSLSWNDPIDPTSLPISISPGMSREFHPRVQTSPTSVAGRHELVLRAKGTTNTTEIVLGVEIGRKDLFEIRSILPPDSSDTYRLITGENTFEVLVRNMGNFYDTTTIEVLSSPSFAQVRIVHVKVGTGSMAAPVLPGQGVNISGLLDNAFNFTAEPSTVTVSFNPGQTASLGLATDIEQLNEALGGKLVLKYTYGTYSSSKVLELELKVVLSDVEILSTDSDSIPDLDIFPEPDYEVGDRIQFRFIVKNNYPYPTMGLEWTVELSGSIIIRGDLGEIGPGMTMEFNVSWKADATTRDRNPAIVRIMGRGYTDINTAPSAKTDESIYVSQGPGGPPWGLLTLYVGFISVIIAALVIAWVMVQSQVRRKEEEERKKYEALYGPRKKELLKSSRTSGKESLPSKGRAPLPPARSRPGRISPGKARPTTESRRKGRRLTLGGQDESEPKKKERIPGPPREEGPFLSDLEGGEGNEGGTIEASSESPSKELSSLNEVDEFEE